SSCISDSQKKGQPSQATTAAIGSKKNTCPNTSIQSRTRLGNALFTMSMRMCSFDRSVQGAQRRKTAPNRIHCSSSQEFDEALNTLRMMALTALTTTATRIAQAITLPTRMLKRSTARLKLNNRSTFILRIWDHPRDTYGFRHV